MLTHTIDDNTGRIAHGQALTTSVTHCCNSKKKKKEKYYITIQSGFERTQPRDWCASRATQTSPSDSIRRNTTTWNTIRTNNNELLRTGAATREENTHRSYMCSHDRYSFESIQRVRYAIYTDGQRIACAQYQSRARDNRFSLRKELNS